MKRLGFERRAALGLLFLTGLSGAVGCGILDEGKPNNARVVIEGGGGQEFTLVTSNDFTITVDETGQNRQVELNQADTITVSAPYNQVYPLGSGIRFYLKAYNDVALTDPITVRVRLGGEERFSSTSALEGVAIEFLYSFR